ncbi:MAG: hypothetical protein IJB76_00380 [Clostridia bacterium]|nr:hypothetical protein [Clostridia bacterium]
MSKHTAIRRSTLVSSIAMLLVAVMALSGATYAWFSSNDAASAEKLTLTATTSSGLYIVEDESMANTTAPTTGFSSKITWSDNVENMKAVSGKPTGSASSAFYTTTTDRADGIYNGDKVNYPIDTANAGTDYIVKKIWVKADTTESVKLKITPTVTGGRGYERVAIAAADGASTIFASSVETYAQFGQDGPIDGSSITTVEYATGETYQNTYDVAKCFYVFVWFEGQDTQCTNVNSGSTFDVSLGFELVG